MSGSRLEIPENGLCIWTVKGREAWPVLETSGPPADVVPASLPFRVRVRPGLALSESVVYFLSD